MTDQESKKDDESSKSSTAASRRRGKKKPSTRSSAASATQSGSQAASRSERPAATPDAVAVTPTHQERPADGAGSGGKALSIGAIVLSLLALAGAGYAWYQTAVNARLAGGEQTQRISSMEQRFSDISSSQSGVTGQIDEIKSRVAASETAIAEQVSQVKQLVSKTESALSAEISEIRSSVNEQQKKVAASVAQAEQEVASQTEQFRTDFNQLSSSIGEVKNELGSSVDRWSEREIEHLLLIANQRLQLGNDPDSARQALQLAENKLRDSDKPSMLKVRQQISSELAALYEVKAPDLASATGTLSLLSQTLGDLPVRGETNVPAAVNNTEAGDSPEEGDESGGTGERIARLGKNFLSDLGGLVQVEKGGEPVAPSITPEVSRMIVARARLMLEGAQVALLRGQPEIYTGRLGEAAVWVSENFETEAAATQNWLSQLEEVKAISPTVEFPDISGSLQSLRDAMAAGGQVQ